MVKAEIDEWDDQSDFIFIPIFIPYSSKSRAIWLNAGYRRWRRRIISQSWWTPLSTTNYCEICRYFTPSLVVLHFPGMEGRAPQIDFQLTLLEVFYKLRENSWTGNLNSAYYFRIVRIVLTRFQSRKLLQIVRRVLRSYPVKFCLLSLRG